MKNPAFKSFQDTHALLNAKYGDDYDNEAVSSLDFALVHAPQTGALRILHPLFIRDYREPRRRFSDKPLTLVGMDVETEASNGSPRLFGYHYPSGRYHADTNPSLGGFYRVISALRNSTDHHLVVWSRLDIQVIMRLFSPNEKERRAISASLTGRVQNGVITVPFACQRTLRDGTTLFIGHYIPGRSLRVGWLDGKYERSVWVYNLSHFYRGRIADIAPSLGLDWKEYPRDSHIINWERFARDKDYRQICLDSNQQDARTVQQMSVRLQDDFYRVFKAYPNQLVSTGSLADAAVSSMLTDVDYNATSGVWLRKNGLGDKETNVKLDTLLGEAYSAGYVDQTAVGYFPKVVTADISAAYPHKIRALPDLRHAILRHGTGNYDADVRSLHADGYQFWTAIIRGTVTIPSSLRFHPITIRNRFRQNYRAIGTFPAAYIHQEREFVLSRGGTFENEEYVIVGLTKFEPSPLAQVSTKLGVMRAEMLAERAKHKKDTPEWLTYEALQTLIKVVDNSLYGKTVMTLEVMALLEGAPSITGYTTGDRFNLLYGTVTTALTRTQLADACMRIVDNGGNPIMCMTDAMYWEGTADMLPAELWRVDKTPGYFEKPEYEEDFYILKTGQYEYKKDGKFTYKLRGIPARYERDDQGQSEMMLTNGRLPNTQPFFRTLVREFADANPGPVKGKDVLLRVPTRRLATIGQPDSLLLGAVLDGEMELKPFALSTKTDSFRFDWRACIDGHVWIPPVRAKQGDGLPFSLLRETYEQGFIDHVEHYKGRKKKTNVNMSPESLRLL